MREGDDKMVDGGDALVARRGERRLKSLIYKALD
jgi:hypothetical protein